MTDSPATSPLAEADPKSLDQIFSMDPRDLTLPEMDIAIEAMRKMRDQWSKDEAQGRRSSPKAKAMLTAAAPGISLDDLGL